MKKKTIVATSTQVSAEPREQYSPAVYHQDEGRKALAALRPKLAAIKDGELVNVRVDVDKAMLAGLAVAGFVLAPKVHERFARLPAEEFDMTALDGLAPACCAAIFALVEAKKSGAMESEAKVPDDVAAEAAEIEARMQKVCEYNLSDDPEIRDILDLLRPGSGHRDLGHDLNGYAGVYEARPDVVSGDKKNYRPGDAKRAKELATVLLQGVSSAWSPQTREAYETHVKTWTLAYKRYEEVRAAGLWLFRDDPAKEKLFPSLFTAGRPSVGRPRKQPSTEPGTTAPGGDTPPVT